MTRRERRKQKRLIDYLIITATLTIMVILGIEEYKDSKVKKQEDTEYFAEKLNVEYNQEEKQTKEYPKEEIQTEYKGYKVAAKLEVPQIDLETYILTTHSEKSLNISVTKFWGADPNQKGNFCIAGHNAKNKNMFNNLRDLNIGDVLWLSDNQVGKIEYEIYDIYTVEPDDVKCLSQETEGRREITLITCTNDSKKRIIVKAKEKLN